MNGPRAVPTPWARGDTWAQTAGEARAFDARAIDTLGIAQTVLMENAGRAAAVVVRDLHREGHVVGLVGAGNNGGDALVALRALSTWGVDVRGVATHARSDDPLLHGWVVPVDLAESLDDTGWAALLAGASVVIDGLLGTGARGAPRAGHARIIDKVNASGLPVVSLDVPSGIDATTGAVEGAAIRAHTTVSFGAPKVGSLLHPARAHVGRHLVVEMGFPPIRPEEATARLVTPAWALGRVPRRGTDTHKNRVGRVLIVGGGPGMAGAALLAARAAFRTGAGLVRVAAAETNRAAVQAALPEAIFVPLGDVHALGEAASASDAVVVGPGLGQDEEARNALLRIVEVGRARLLLDADALNLGALGVVDIGAVDRPILATPHPGEMERLGPVGDEDEASGPMERVRQAADALGCAVLLKGAPSVVRDRDGPTWIDTQSTSDLAVAGMGDTLAGVAGTLMAQGLPPDEAGALGLYLSGRAARIADRGPGLTPSDVIDHLPDALSEAPPERPVSDFPFLLFEAEPAR